jgi:hypothetical protein
LKTNTAGGFCSNCGSPYQPGESIYCGQCGKQLATVTKRVGIPKPDKRTFTTLYVAATVVIIGLLLIFVISIASHPKNSIVGTWTTAKGVGIEFFKDGTLKGVGRMPYSGYYRFPDKKHIELEYEGFLRLGDTQIYAIKIKGDKLTLTSDDDTLELFKAK